MFSKLFNKSKKTFYKESKSSSDMANSLGDGFAIIFGDLFKDISKNITSIKKNRKKGDINNFKLGLIAMHKNKPRIAAIRFLIASKFNPKSPIPHYYMARCMLTLRKIDRAVYHMKYAILLRKSMRRRIEVLCNEATNIYPEDVLQSIKLMKEARKVKKEKLDKREDIFERIGKKAIDVIILIGEISERIIESCMHFFTRYFKKKKPNRRSRK